MARIGFLVTVMVVLCVAPAWAGFLDWFRSSANKGHSICKVDFEVLDPKGLRLWTAHKPETKMFGIELYINPTVAVGQNAGRSNPQLVCSVCQNVTEVKHGKFFIQDDNVIVKKGDVLEYVAITDNGKTVQRHKPRKIVVSGECAALFLFVRLISFQAPVIVSRFKLLIGTESVNYDQKQKLKYILQALQSPSRLFS